MNDLEKPIATAGAQIQLVSANAYVDFAVIVNDSPLKQEACRRIPASSC